MCEHTFTHIYNLVYTNIRKHNTMKPYTHIFAIQNRETYTDWYIYIYIKTHRPSTHNKPKPRGKNETNNRWWENVYEWNGEYMRLICSLCVCVCEYANKRIRKHMRMKQDNQTRQLNSRGMNETRNTVLRISL